MKEFFKSIIDQIPPLPESVRQIESFAKDPDISYKRVAKTLESDPVLTSEILKAANSPIYGFSRKISTLESAIALFGLGTIRGFVLAVYVRNNFEFNLDPYAMSPKQFAVTAALHHALATNWYFASNPSLFNILSPATFLSNLGQVLISQYLMAEHKEEAFKDALTHQDDVKELEKTFCNTTAVRLTAEVFDHWSLEESLVRTLHGMQEPDEASEEQRLYAQILHCIHTAVPYNGAIGDKNVEKATALSDLYGLDTEKFVKAVETIR